jgi:hypothetical protein
MIRASKIAQTRFVPLNPSAKAKPLSALRDAFLGTRYSHSAMIALGRRFSLGRAYLRSCPT